MKSFATKLLFFALSTLRVKTSFLVPEDLADGVYIVDTKSSVVLAHTAPIANSARNMEHPHNIVACQELPGNTVQCNGYDINGADYDRALIGLYNWCNAGNSIPSSQAILYSYGAAVACMCVYFGRQSCPNNEWTTANNLMDTSCGRNRAGWVSLNVYGKSYGRSRQGVNVCF